MTRITCGATRPSAAFSTFIGIIVLLLLVGAWFGPKRPSAELAAERATIEAVALDGACDAAAAKKALYMRDLLSARPHVNSRHNYDVWASLYDEKCTK